MKGRLENGIEGIREYEQEGRQEMEWNEIQKYEQKKGRREQKGGQKIE